MRLLLSLVAFAALAPAAAAAPEVVARFAPVDGAMVMRPGDSRDLELRWSIELQETTCSDATEFGIDFLVEEKPAYLGGSFQPAGTRSPKPPSEGRVTLTVVAGSSAPASRSDLILLPDLRQLNAQCAPEPSVREERLTVTAIVERVPAASDPSADASDPAPVRHSPGANAFAAVFLMAAILVVRRRSR